jgi:hypothetical protein
MRKLALWLGVVSLWITASGCAVGGSTGVNQTPGMTLSQQALSFGSVTVGSTATKSVTLSNTGNANLTISQVSVSGNGFSSSGLTPGLAVAPNTSATVAINFAPSAAGSSAGSLTISSSASTSPSVLPLSATGVTAATPTVSVTPANLAFGNVNVGTSGTQSITIQNTGTANLVVNSASVSGTGYTVSGMSAPLTVAPGGSTALAVSFTPSNTGTAAGNVALSSNAQASPAAVALTGNGVSTASQPLTITQGALPQATTGQPYSATLQASGGKPSYTWSLASGQLPAGLTLAASGVASGTPQAPGQSNVTVAVTDSSSPTPQTATMSATVTVGAAPLQISTTNLPSATVGTLFLALLAATGGTPPYQWSAASGSLPAGLTLGASSGQITGTPTQASSSSVPLEVTDASSATASASVPLTVDAGSSSGPQQAGCGSPDGLTRYDQSTCGNVGDPYEGNGAPKNPTLITACGSFSPTAGQVYQVSQNIGSDPTAVCINFGFTGNPYTLNLNGYTVTGQIKDNGGFGRTILNGTINCSVPDGSNTGCINYYPQTAKASAQSRFHHLTVHNSTAGSRDIYAEWDGGTTAYSGCQLRIDHVTLNPVVSGGRSYGISFVGSGARSPGCFQADHNMITMPSDPNANAIQGIVGYYMAMTAQYNYINNNNFVGGTNGGDSYRAILCDGEGQAVIAPGPCLVTNNYIDAENSRAFRDRFYANYNVQYNYFDHIRFDNRYGAIHIGEPDSGLDNDIGTVQNNTFVLQDGKAVYVAQTVGPVISNNTAVCDTTNGCAPRSLFGNADTLNTTVGATDATWNNNPSIANIALAVPQILVCDGSTNCTFNAGVKAASTVCNSGTPGGGGNISAGSCQ